MPEPVPGFQWLETSRPQGSAAQLPSGRIDVRDVNPQLLRALNSVGQTLRQKITIFSGYRTSAYSAQVGGFAGDPHTRGIAVDAYVGTTPIGSVPGVSSVLSRYGIISGNQPNFYQGRPDPPHVQLATSTSGGGAITQTTQQPPAWEIGVLRGIGAPVTGHNLNFLRTWAHFEGTAAKYNPLATTQPAPGATPLSGNPDGVKNYPSATVGVHATTQTLLNGRYGSIVDALRSGDPWKPQYRTSGDIASELRTWGTKNFASLWMAGDIPPAGITGGTPASDAYGAIADSSVGQAVGGVVSGVSSVGDAIGWVFHNGDRILEVVGGFALLAVGLFLLGRQMVGQGTDVNKLLSGQVSASAQRKGYSEGFEMGRTYTEAQEGAAAQRSADRAAIRRNRSSATRTAPTVSGGSNGSDDIPY